MSAAQEAHPSWPPGDACGLAATEAGTFHVEVMPDRDRVLVCPAGEVDLATADILESQIVDLLQNGFERVVIDLRAVTFIDSTGIRALLIAHQRARESGHAISIILGGPATRRPLEIVGLTKYLELEPSRDGTS